MTDPIPGPSAGAASPATATRKLPYPRECDLVLKGGITSGVVYPGAIAEFSRHYDFRQIGGTSAGAIAAAAAAAAQLGRASGANPKAFDELAKLPDLLGEIGPAGQSRLFQLFRPTAEAAPLFDTLTAAAGAGKAAVLRVAFAALRRYPLWAAAGAAPALAGAAVSPMAATVLACTVQIVLFGLGLAVGVILTLATALLRDATRVLPRQGWGMSSGVSRDAGSTAAPAPAAVDPPGAGSAQAQAPADEVPELNGADRRGAEDRSALSNWLHEYLNHLAGLPGDQVLTFGHLWLGSGAAPTDTIEPAARRISFKAMTTGLNVQRPFILPFEGKDEQDLYFRENDLLAVLPRAVVQHMVAKARALPAPDKDAAEVATRLAQGFLRLPRAHDLPVLLAVRMSLSFPILLSAVRLFKPDYTRSTAHRLQPLWFSDGGICSNLPVHLFDAPLPTRPTFTIDLVEPLKPDCANQNDVRVPMKAQDGSQGPRNYFHEKTGFGSIAAFLMTAVDSARNWVDNSQLRLKGYSERVGSVAVHADEGGLNLSMPQAAITALSQRGTDVAKGLHTAFSTEVWPSPESSARSNGWDRHQWLRLRNHLGALSSYFLDIRSALASLEQDLQGLQDLVDRHPGTNTDEDRDAAQREALRDLLAALSAVLENPAVRAVVDKSGGVLRIHPR